MRARPRALVTEVIIARTKLRQAISNLSSSCPRLCGSTTRLAAAPIGAATCATQIQVSLAMRAVEERSALVVQVLAAETVTDTDRRFTRLTLVIPPETGLSWSTTRPTSRTASSSALTRPICGCPNSASCSRLLPKNAMDSGREPSRSRAKLSSVRAQSMRCDERRRRRNDGRRGAM